MDVSTKKTGPALQPLALRDAPALIEKVFPAQKISAEAQKERKAGAGQTLTALGSYWKGRKPLIMARAIVLAALLPTTEDLEADLDVYERLMAMDDAAFGRREPKLKAGKVATKVKLKTPWDFFAYGIAKNKKDDAPDSQEIDRLVFPIDLSRYPGLSIRWRRDIDPADKHRLFAEAMTDLPYEEKVRLCKRPEECDPDVLYGPVWDRVNKHLFHLGVEAYSHENLVEQLGILRYGHRPRVGDTFCGGGSIPFEAARLGCDVYASDLNPVACMLTWGALNIIGASAEKRAEIEKAQKEVADAVDQEITALGIEHNSRGDRAKAYLYCLETRCPETGWIVPMAPSWVISKTRNVYAKLVPDYDNKHFDIEIITGGGSEEMKVAGQGTVQNGQLVYELDGKVYRTPIRTLRGDYRNENGNSRNKLRQWEKQDFKPRPDDIFQERLYCIQWITKESIDSSRKDTYFAAVTDEDLERERRVERMVRENLAHWQDKGLVPDMAIERGAETTRLSRERGWRYWHHLFNPRELHYLGLIKAKIYAETMVFFPKILDFCSKLLHWIMRSPNSVGGTDFLGHVFYNQAFNTFFNWGHRSFGDIDVIHSVKTVSVKKGIQKAVSSLPGDQCSRVNEVWITDPPYADAINYHEITEYFIAWLRKNPPPAF